MFADEGLGVHLCKQLEKNYKFYHSSHTLDFVDGGTLALQLSYIIAKYDVLIVLDCIEADDSKTGEVFFFPYDAMPQKINWSGSAHEVEMLQTLQYMELMGDLPKTHILACIPKRIEEMSFELSNEIGISNEELSLIERGKANPSLYTLQKISAHIGITVSELLKVEEE